MLHFVNPDDSYNKLDLVTLVGGGWFDILKKSPAIY